MLKIRLSRRGKKKQPSYRIVVADSKFKRDGRFVENIGFYNPLTDPATVDIKEDRALYWLSVGAQPTDPVRHLLGKQGTLDRLKRLHAGETLEALVAEYSGVELVEEATEEVAEEVAEVVEEVAEAVEEVVEEVAEAVEEASEEAAEAVEEAAEEAAADDAA